MIFEVRERKNELVTENKSFRSASVRTKAKAGNEGSDRIETVLLLAPLEG